MILLRQYGPIFADFAFMRGAAKNTRSSRRRRCLVCWLSIEGLINKRVMTFAPSFLDGQLTAKNGLCKKAVYIEARWLCQCGLRRPRVKALT